MSDPIAFIDLKTQQARIGDRLRSAIDRVLTHGQYIMGPEVAELEARLSASCGARHTISCANGTEALATVLMAADIGPGDAVFVPSFTFVATAEAAALVGATPVFIDVRPDTFNLDIASLDAAIEEARRRDLRPRAVIPVDLFGQPADHPAIFDLAVSHDMLVVDDAAQGFGARLGNRAIGTFGHATTTSFFPAKPLGCYGDGGAIFTDDDDLAEALRSIRVHGKGTDKYDNVRIGLNGRLDTLQAAILLEKLAIFDEELSLRDKIAQRYTSALSDIVQTPIVLKDARSAWAQYTLKVDDRASLLASCKAEGIPTQVYYRIPLHRQSGYAHYPTAPAGCPVSEQLATQVISIPMHPYLTEIDQDRVITTVLGAIGSNRL